MSKIEDKGSWELQEIMRRNKQINARLDLMHEVYAIQTAAHVAGGKAARRIRRDTIALLRRLREEWP